MVQRPGDSGSGALQAGQEHVGGEGLHHALRISGTKGSVNCNCITEVNEKLKDKNLRLNCSALIYEEWETRIYLRCEWIDKSKAPVGARRNPTPIFVKFCPFCGKLAAKNKGELHVSA